MLNRRPRPSCHSRQAGVVIVVALIVLVAMTLAGLSLIRSMDTSNLIAGNMAFQQAATHSSDSAVEAGVRWLEANNTNSLWDADALRSQGYFATRQEGAAALEDADWPDQWTNGGLSASAVGTDATGNVVACASAAQDNAGNRSCYVIERLCNLAGDPSSPTDLSGQPRYCSRPQTAAASAGSSKGSGVIALQYNAQVYYRITVRVNGPRSTERFIQAIVAL